MTWGLSILLSTTMYAAHILAIKVLGERFSSSFVTPAFYVVAVSLLGGIYLIERPKVDWSALAAQPGIMIAIAVAGITIAMTDFFFVKSLNLGAEASIAMPLLVGGGTAMVAILGCLLFQESMSLYKIAGIACVILGVTLINKGDVNPSHAHSHQPDHSAVATDQVPS